MEKQENLNDLIKINDFIKTLETVVSGFKNSVDKINERLDKLENKLGDFEKKLIRYHDAMQNYTNASMADRVKFQEEINIQKQNYQKLQDQLTKIEILGQAILDAQNTEVEFKDFDDEDFMKDEPSDVDK